MTDEDSSAQKAAVDPTYRIGHLRAAHQGVVSVSPDADISVAITEMWVKDFSQLVVMSGPRKLAGMISWRAIARRMAMDKSVSKVRECLEVPRVVQLDASLLMEISTIAENDYVLVEGLDKQICGIVTAADLSLEFQKLTEPFLLLSQMERHMREIIGDRVPLDGIKDDTPATTAMRRVRNVSDLTLGQLVRIVERPDNWAGLSLGDIDRVIFSRNFERANQLRNKVMHFSADDLTKEDIVFLRCFANFVKDIHSMRLSDRRTEQAQHVDRPQSP